MNEVSRFYINAGMTRTMSEINFFIDNIRTNRVMSTNTPYIKLPTFYKNYSI